MDEGAKGRMYIAYEHAFDICNYTQHIGVFSGVSCSILVIALHELTIVCFCVGAVRWANG